MGIKMILGERGKENWEKRKRKDGGGGGGGRRWRDQSVGKVQPAVGERRGKGGGQEAKLAEEKRRREGGR